MSPIIPKQYSPEEIEFFFGAMLMRFYVDDKLNRKMYINYLDSIVNSKIESNKGKIEMLSKEAEFINFLTYPEVASPKKNSPNVSQTTNFLRDHPGLNENEVHSLGAVVSDYMVIQKMIDNGTEILSDLEAGIVLNLKCSISKPVTNYCFVKILPEIIDNRYIIPAKSFKAFKKEGLIRLSKWTSYYVPVKEMVSKKNLKDAMNKEFSEGST